MAGLGEIVFTNTSRSLDRHAWLDRMVYLHDMVRGFFVQPVPAILHSYRLGDNSRLWSCAYRNLSYSLDGPMANKE